jgi:hypothetical protein
MLRLSNEFKDKLADAGVTFTNIDRGEFIQATEKYYSYPEFSAWTPGLRDTVLAIIGGK